MLLSSKSKSAPWVDNLHQCPYDKCHQIRGDRYLIHIVKCRQNYVKKLEDLGLPVESIKCRFDCGMRCLPPEVMNHETICDLKPPFAGMEDWFDEETIQETQKLMKEERQKLLGWKGHHNVAKHEGVAVAKQEEEQVERTKEIKKISGLCPRNVADMEWEAGDQTEEDWGKEDTGVTFSLFKPLMPMY